MERVSVCCLHCAPPGQPSQNRASGCYSPARLGNMSPLSLQGPGVQRASHGRHALKPDTCAHQRRVGRWRPGAGQTATAWKRKEKRKMVPAIQSTKTTSADWKEAESGCVDCAQTEKKKKKKMVPADRGRYEDGGYQQQVGCGLLEGLSLGLGFKRG